MLRNRTARRNFPVATGPHTYPYPSTPLQDRRWIWGSSSSTFIGFLPCHQPVIPWTYAIHMYHHILLTAVTSPALGQSADFQDVLKQVKQRKSPNASRASFGVQAAPMNTAVQVCSGVYEIDLVPPREKRGTSSILGSGERLIMGYGLKPDEFRYIDRSVRVRGRRFHGSAGQFQQPQGHLSVSQIGLAPGRHPTRCRFRLAGPLLF